MSNWKRLSITLGITYVLVGEVLVFRSVQRKRDLAETLAWMDQTYNPHDGGVNFGRGHGSISWKIETGTFTGKKGFVRLSGCKIYAQCTGIRDFCDC